MISNLFAEVSEMRWWFAPHHLPEEATNARWSQVS